MKKLIVTILILVSHVTYSNAEDIGVYCEHHDGVSSISVAANDKVAYSQWRNDGKSKVIAYRYITKTGDCYHYEGRLGDSPGTYHLSVSLHADFIKTNYKSGNVSVRSYFSENCRSLKKDEVAKLMAEGAKK